MNNVSFRIDSVNHTNFSFQNISGLNETRDEEGGGSVCAWDNWMTTYRVICEVYISMPISLLGIVGNVVSFVVLSMQKQSLTTSVLLQGLSVADTMILFCTVLLRSMRYLCQCLVYCGAYTRVFRYIFRWVYPFVFLFRMCSTWLTGLLTIDRYIAVCHPLHAKKFCTMSRTYMHMFMVVIFSAVFSIPRFFEMTFDSDDSIKPTKMSTNKYYTIIYKIVLFTLLMYVVPMVLLVALNSRLISKLKHSQSAEALMRRRNKDKRAFNSKRAVTNIIVIVVIVFVLCNIGALTSQILIVLTLCFENLKYLDWHRRIASNISNVMVTFNSATNFVIYCFCSRYFRLVLMRTFGCQQLKKQCSNRNQNQLYNLSRPGSFASPTRGPKKLKCITDKM